VELTPPSRQLAGRGRPHVGRCKTEATRHVHRGKPSVRLAAGPMHRATPG